MKNFSGVVKNKNVSIKVRSIINSQIIKLIWTIYLKCIQTVFLICNYLYKKKHYKY